MRVPISSVLFQKLKEIRVDGPSIESHTRVSMSKYTGLGILISITLDVDNENPRLSEFGC